MENFDNSTFNALKIELEFYRQNQAIVEEEIKALISDNKKLSQQVGSLLKEKLQYEQAYNNDQSKEFEESKSQTAQLTKERDSLHVLWQTAQRTIEALETELMTYQNYNGRRMNQNNSEERRNLELKLQTALSDYVELESKYKKVHAERNYKENDLNKREKEIEYYKERGKEVERELEELKKVLDECKINLAAERKSHEDLKSQLLVCQKGCADKIKKESEAKSKVAEALQLFDLVSAQKNDAYRKLAEVTEELSKVKLILANVKRDTEDNFRAELDEVKQNYNAKVSDMLQHIRNLDTELVEKGLLLNKALREIKVLQTTNENHVQQEKDHLKSVDPKLAVAEQKLEAVFQELVLSERRNIQLICEKQTLALDLQRAQDNHARESKRRDWEEQLLKTQIQELRLQVEHLQKSLDETHSMISKLQTMLSSRTQLSQKMVSTKEDELTEVNKHLENQMQLNKKWKESYVDMTEKLKTKLDELQKENKELRIQLNMPYISTSQDNSSASL